VVHVAKIDVNKTTGVVGMKNPPNVRMGEVVVVVTANPVAHAIIPWIVTATQVVHGTIKRVNVEARVDVICTTISTNVKITAVPGMVKHRPVARAIPEVVVVDAILTTISTNVKVTAVPGMVKHRPVARAIPEVVVVDAILTTISTNVKVTAVPGTGLIVFVPVRLLLKVRHKVP